MADTNRSFLFSGTDSGSSVAELGLTLLRVFAGVALALAHGLGKLPPSEGFVEGIGNMGFPAPGLFAWLSGIAEFFGGLLLAAGLLVRPAALLVAANMFVAVVFMHILTRGDPFAGYELALFFFFTAVAFALKGGGRYSIDAKIRGGG